MKIIGLTGGIACGKSTVAEILRKRGQYIIDADRIAHDLQQPGEPGYEALVKLFGTWVVNPMRNWNLYRARLGKLVFSDPEALAALDAVMHPLVHHEFLRRIGDLVVSHPEVELVVYDVPLLFEVNAEGMMNATICVHMKPDNQLRRLMDRNDLDIDEARRRIDAQMPLAQKKAKADFCIDNNGTKEELETNTINQWNELIHSGILTS